MEHMFSALGCGEFVGEPTAKTAVGICKQDSAKGKFERFSLLFAIFRDAPVGQYGYPWSEVPQGNIKGTKVTRFSKCINAKK